MGKPGNSKNVSTPIDNIHDIQKELQKWKKLSVENEIIFDHNGELTEEYIRGFSNKISKQATPDVAELYNQNHSKYKFKLADENKYDYRDQTIYLESDSDIDYSSISHEVAHAIDNDLGKRGPTSYYSDSYRIAPALRRDFIKTKGTYQFDFDDEIYAPVSDALDSVLYKDNRTNAKIRKELHLNYGHGRGYWEGGNNLITGREFIANYISAKATNPKALKAYRTIFPEASALGDKIIMDMNNEIAKKEKGGRNVR